MNELLQVYQCELCGNIVEMIHASAGRLTCCNKAMTLLTENSVDAATEKHVPIVERTDDGIKVTVGSVPHPMLDEHYVEWIQLVADGKSYRQFLKPGDAPVAFFKIDANNITAREFCNLHGHWKGV